jgi:hypothetical protein
MTIGGATRAASREAQSATPDAVAPEHLDELVAPGLLDVPAVDEVIDKYNDRLVEGAKRYASYDRSDPFTTDRCMAHIRQGLCKSIEDTEGLPWHWIETDDKGRTHNQRTQLKGPAGAPGHYDVFVLSAVRDGQVELTHRDLRRP